VLGNNFSIADIHLAAPIEFSPAVGCDYERFPHVKAWLSRVTSRDAWKKS
jgi:glutathione S-transferase